MKQPNVRGMRPQTYAHADSLSQRGGGVASSATFPLIGPFWHWWLSHTSNSNYTARTFDERIRLRRSRVGSGIFLGLIVISLALLVLERLTTSDLPTFYALVVAVIGLALGCVLNRFNQVELAGGLVALIIDAAIFGAVLSAPGGLLDTDYLGSYYLMALILGVVAILMPSWGLLIATVVNCALIAVDFIVLQGYTPALSQQLAADGYFFEIGRPIALNVGIAFALYILVRTLLGEGRRADRAEELAELEEREIERQRLLEEEVRELLAVHVQLANGNFNARVTQLGNPLLWQIGASLNNLMNRLARLGQADFAYQRTVQENQRLALALRMLLDGRIPLWPAPTGTSTDTVLAAVQAIFARLASGDTALLSQLSQHASGGIATRDMQPRHPAEYGGPDQMPPSGQPPSSAPGFGAGFSGGQAGGDDRGPVWGGAGRPPWRTPQLQPPPARGPDTSRGLGAPPRDSRSAPSGPPQDANEPMLPPWLRTAQNAEGTGWLPQPSDESDDDSFLPRQHP